VRAVVLTPWPTQPTTMQQSNHATIARLGQVPVRTLRQIPSPELAELADAGAPLLSLLD
jgi:hypothetical protein